jgi:hypothetical protein
LPIENEEQAVEALFAAIEQDRGEGNLSTTDQANVNAQREQATVQQPAEGSEGTTESSDSFTGIDPNTLPEEAQAFYKSMQADYTRSKQALAEERKQFEALEEFGGVEAAVEAARFAQALATDPQFALGVHEQLTTALKEAGLTQEQASAEASRQITETQQADPNEFSYDDEQRVDPALERELQTLRQEIEEQKAWRVQQEETAQTTALAQEIMAQENEVRQTNPKWDEDDVKYVYDLAYSTGGNLLQAAELYKGLQQTVLSRYIDQKGSVPSGVSSPASGGNAEQPTKFTDLNDPELERLALEYVAQQNALGNS